MRSLKVLAASSGGGHWQQLMALKPSFERYDVSYLTTNVELGADVPGSRVHVVADCNARSGVAIVRCLREVMAAVVAERPDVVISTGAAPGLIALAVGKMRGADTIWIDSVANSERLSLSGRLARFTADLWLTQWEELAREHGPHYLGGIL